MAGIPTTGMEALAARRNGGLRYSAEEARLVRAMARAGVGGLPEGEVLRAVSAVIGPVGYAIMEAGGDLVVGTPEVNVLRVPLSVLLPEFADLLTVSEVMSS